MIGDNFCQNIWQIWNQKKKHFFVKDKMLRTHLLGFSFIQLSSFYIYIQVGALSLKKAPHLNWKRIPSWKLFQDSIASGWWSLNSNRPTLSMAGPASSRCSQEITVPSLGKGSLQCSITDAVVFTYVAISMKRITVETFLRHIILQLATGPRSEFPRSSMTRSSSTEFLFWHLIKIMKTNFPKKMLYIFP